MMSTEFHVDCAIAPYCPGWKDDRLILSAWERGCGVISGVN